MNQPAGKHVDNRSPQQVWRQDGGRYENWTRERKWTEKRQAEPQGSVGLQPKNLTVLSGGFQKERKKKAGLKQHWRTNGWKLPRCSIYTHKSKNLSELIKKSMTKICHSQTVSKSRHFCCQTKGKETESNKRERTPSPQEEKNSYSDNWFTSEAFVARRE